MGAPEVEAFLTHLAVEGKVAAATQNQALSALLFLYREVLGIELPWLKDVTRAKRPQHLPVVLTRDEVRAVLAKMDGVYGLLARLLYGTGMRLMEVIQINDSNPIDITVFLMLLVYWSKRGLWGIESWKKR